MMMSIAIPFHGAREEWTLKTIQNTHNIHYVKEIVISMEPSERNYADFFARLKLYPKVKIFKNEKNLFVFRNKINAVSKCTNEWVALIDSDNITTSQYYTIFNRVPNKENRIIYSPAEGLPQLDYRCFIGHDIGIMDAGKLLGDGRFDMLFNTMNYVFHRETWLAAQDKSDYEPRTADSSWINYNCLKSGMVIRVVKDMFYYHTMHALNADHSFQSTYRMYHKEGETENKKIRQMIKELCDARNNSSTSVQSRRQESVPPASNWTATGGQGGTVVPEQRSPDKAALLSD